MTVTKNGISIPVKRYEGDLSCVVWADGYPDILRGKTIEEQMDLFTVRFWGFDPRDEENFGTEEDLRNSGRSLDRNGKITLLEHDGIIVGLESDDEPVLAGQCRCTWYAEDNNGAGYKSAEEWVALYCYPCPRS